ncbi:bifunctional P-loop containing nucleoside triphosphate hydrolase/Structural maintenance of chromosomes protein 5/RecF-RecN-SMC [Babesia duncani]|uniref:Structural maintenance of chromosomes protein 5 n=1 Tax=Babesia duncani TaxID=323732 RepID=A0AAD9PP67_9APIC|nr:bifunctional P-loop containing nucleoside triphosphate hydrolase/Structural maintenance of chromosomes protein 5/RecF-RecN-SMC [Babesia duncani]
MENWMAYTGPVVLHANPGVNIIAAANGCGKSAIVCAIALGLGYDLSVLSRGDNIRAFVKRGCMFSNLMIGLVDDDSPNGMIVIGRTIQLFDMPQDEATPTKGKFTTTVKNEWTLDGAHATFDSVRKIQMRLNLQVNNILTFLAQANVGKFAAMTPQELFKNTFRAIDDGLVAQFDELIQISTKLQAKRSEAQTLVRELNSSNLKISQYKVISESLKRLKEATLRKDLINLQLLKIKIENLTRGSKITQSRIENLEMEHERIKEQHKAVEGKYRNLKRQCNTRLTEAKQNLADAKSNKLVALHSDTNALDKCFYECITQVKTFALKFKRDSQNKSTTREEQRLELKEKLQSVNSEIEEIKTRMINTTDLVNEIADYSSRDVEIRGKLWRIKNETPVPLINRQINSLMRFIPVMKRERYSSYFDYCNEKSQDACTLLAGDIRVVTDLNCCIIEDAVGRYLECFIIDTNDRNADFNITRMLHDYKLPTITVPKIEHVLCKVTEPMRRFGVVAFLHELVQYSNVNTIQVLSSVAHLNECFLVDQDLFFKLAKNTDGTISDDYFNDFYKVMISEISSQLSKKVTTLKYYIGYKKHLYKQFQNDPNFFTDNETEIHNRPKVLYNFSSQQPITDTTNNEIQELENELNEIVDKMTLLKTELNELNKENKDANRRLYALSRQQVHITKILESIGAGDDGEILESRDWKVQFQELKQRQSEMLQQAILDRGTDLMEWLDNIKNRRSKLVQASKQYNIYCKDSVEMEKLKEEYEQVHEIYKQGQSQLRILSNTLRMQEENLLKYKDEAAKLQITINATSEDLASNTLDQTERSHITPLLIRQEAGLGLENKSEADLETELNAAIAQVQHLEMDDYQEAHNAKCLQEEMIKKQRLEENVNVINEEITSTNTCLNSKFEGWHAQILQIVRQLDEKFGQCMKYVGAESDGQIRLDVDLNDIKNCNIKILVKFQKEKDLLPLSSSYQSGGERGVTTMAYILAVQNLTRNGFFVIDEINQGLDSHYEKKLLDLLLGNAKIQGTTNSSQRPPQYFLLTPQLLPGMNFKGATLHFPLNGPGVLNGLTVYPCKKSPVTNDKNE